MEWLRRAPARKALAILAFPAVLFLCLVPAGMAAEAPEVPPRFRPVTAFFTYLDGGLLNNPMGVFWDPWGRELFVSDTQNHLVGVFQSDGTPLFDFGGGDDLREPIKVVTSPQGRVYVLEVNRKNIREYSYRGEFLGDLGLPGIQDNVNIATLATDREGNLYIGENVSGQILVYDPRHNLKQKFGGRGEKEGQFKSIAGIAVGADGRFYVTDHQATAVQVFDPGGKFLFGFGVHEMGPQNFSLPSGIAVDSKGRILVIDTLRHELKVFARDGKWLINYGGLGVNLGAFAYPVDISIDPSDRIYIVEKMGGRVQVIDEVDGVPPPRR